MPTPPAGEPETNQESTRAADVLADAPRGLFRHASLDKAMGVYLPATVTFRLINFARIWLLTWWMTRQQFGLLTMILLTINIMAPLCSLGLNEAITRYIPQHETRGTLWRFLGRSAALLLGVTLISVVLMIIFSPTLGVLFYAQVFTERAELMQFKAEAPQLAQLSAVVIGVMITYFYLLSFMKGLRMFTALSLAELSHAVLFLGGAFVAWLTQHLSALTLTGIYGISMALPILVFGIGLLRALGSWQSQQGDLGDNKLARTLLRFSIWTTLAGVTWQILVSYPAWFLNKVHGNEAVAVFNFVRQIGQFILIGAVAVSTVILTTVTKTWEAKGREAAIKQLSLAFRGTGLGLMLACGVIALCKDWIIKVVPAEYGPGADILPLQLLFFLIGAYLAFLPIHFQLIERTRHMFWPWAVGVASNVLFAFWLVGPKFEIVRETALWKAIAPLTATIFTTGFSDAQGLDGAAWSGVFAIAAALLMCIALIRAHSSRLDRGTYVVALAAGLLALTPILLAIGLVVLVLLAFGTEVILARSERRRILTSVAGAIGHVPSLKFFARKLGGRGDDGA